jgi:hypothetical protein
MWCFSKPKRYGLKTLAASFSFRWLEWVLARYVQLMGINAAPYRCHFALRKFLLDGKTFWEYFAIVITYRVSSDLKVYPLIFWKRGMTKIFWKLSSMIRYCIRDFVESRTERDTLFSKGRRKDQEMYSQSCHQRDRHWLSTTSCCSRNLWNRKFLQATGNQEGNSHHQP